MKRLTKRTQPPADVDWTMLRARHRALRRADAAGLQFFTEFCGKDASGALTFKVWSGSQEQRYLVRTTDTGEPLSCSCPYRATNPDADPCKHLAAVWLYLHPRATVKPLPTPRPARQPLPTDRDHRQDPVTHVA